jgi:predicted glycogen debranching enzyme
MINFGKDICTDFQESVSREWLETNGIGGFASSTISGANTRRYHGLLTAATKPPLGRLVLLSKFEETLLIGEDSFGLSANQYPDNVYPKGFQYLKGFRLEPFPIWTFDINGIELEKRVFMVYGKNTVICQWSINKKPEDQDQEIKLELKPLLAFRDYHHLQSVDDDFNGEFEVTDHQITIQPFPNMPELIFIQNAESVEETGVWYKNFEYEIEKQRGFDFNEDLFQPFSLTFDLSTTASIIASIEETDTSGSIYDLYRAEVKRQVNLLETANVEQDFEMQLVLAANQFIVSRGAGKTIIAGYPWFSDWGRDTMIALNGLTLATNRPEIAESILLEFSNHISKGMLPNRFPDEVDEAEYNTVDATLWYFEAIRAFAEKTGNYDFVQEHLFEKLVEIIFWHQKGTRFQIHVDRDGLIYAGEEGSQLTWMDAKYDNTVFTPRIGKPVEIQALWYNALCIMADFSERFGDRDGKNQYQSMANLAKQSFNKIFWNEAEECLFDVINGEEEDGSVRPNQIFAVSLPNTMLSIGQAKKIVAKVEEELLTPFGLRSLSPKDPRYRPIYKGSPFERDSAYHQGTVWAWLIGGFVDAYRKVHPNGHKAEERIKEILEGFKIHMLNEGIGQISEIFDGDPPHEPRGCFAQAWSVAEVLRILTDK